MQIAETTQLLTANGIEAVNDLINSSETIELNEQNMNEIYLSSIAEDRTEFTPTEQSTINTIANQCPMSGGPAVFRARSLNYLINPNMSYNDELLCMQQGIQLREQGESKQSVFKVYPNPAKDILYIDYFLNNAEDADFSLYTTIGNKVLTKKLYGSAVNDMVNISALENGVYYFKIFDKNTLLESGKIILLN